PEGPATIRTLRTPRPLCLIPKRPCKLREIGNHLVTYRRGIIQNLRKAVRWLALKIFADRSDSVLLSLVLRIPKAPTLLRTIGGDFFVRQWMRHKECRFVRDKESAAVPICIRTP